MAKYGTKWNGTGSGRMEKVSQMVAEARAEARKQIAAEASGYTCKSCNLPIIAQELSFDCAGAPQHIVHNADVSQ